MIRAVVKNGTIHPLDPMPSTWCDGSEVVVEKAEDQRRSDDIDRWYRKVEESAAAIAREDDQRLEDATNEIRREAKQMARCEMGLA